jgi:hypothetical protein
MTRAARWHSACSLARSRSAVTHSTGGPLLSAYALLNKGIHLGLLDSAHRSARVVRAPSLEHDAQLEAAVAERPVFLEQHALSFRQLARSTALLRIGKRFGLGPKEATPFFEQLARVQLEPQSQLAGDGLDALPSRMECDQSRKELR